MRKAIEASRNDTVLIYWIAGARRIGKTVDILALACRIYQCYEWQTMWIRNKKTELEEDGFLNNFLNSAKRLGHCPEHWETRKDGVYESEDKDAPQIIMFQSISTYSNRRGAETPNVYLMAFDEYMPEDRKYPKGCLKGLLSLTKTVLAGRQEARCICMSNFISAGNPYFVGLQIYPDDDREISVFKEKNMLIEVCKGYKTAIEADNPWNAVYKAGKYQDYADANEDTLIQLVAKKWPKLGEGLDYVILNDGLYYRGFIKNGLVYWERFNGSLKALKVFTPNLQEVGEGVYLLPDFLKEDLKTQVAGNYIRFKNPNVMFGVLNTIYETV